jgi:hypothetical protein
MKTLLIISFVLSSLFVLKQDDFCKYDSILDFEEDEKIEIKQLTKLSYYNQGSRFAIRRDYHKLDLIFSSIYGLETKNFEGYKDREALQSHIDKKDFIVRIQFELPNSKLEVKKYGIGSVNDSMKCVVRVYHLDKTKNGMKIVSRKFSVTSGDLTIEKLSGTTFCGSVYLKVPKYYNLSSKFSVKAISKD